MHQEVNVVEIIAKKRDGEALSSQEIRRMIADYVAGRIPDYQMSALLMSIFFRGMNREEILALTRAMIDCGETIDLSSIPGTKVDKHSTGGVGDKVSLVLAPLVAAAGVPVPMMSGRGLGHTGGTLDKLEAIPGFRTNLSEKEFRSEIEKIGFAMMGQTDRIVPADRKLYALRDVTATVPSLPLICSSIMSKKKAEGTDAIVLDVKVGKGAFCKTREEALRLAKALVTLGEDLSIRTIALLTSMDQPLGRAVGNWIEIREVIGCLQGHGPFDVMKVVEVLGGLMLVLGKKAESVLEGMKIIRECIDSGEGYNRFLDMVKMQGGDPSFIEDPDTYSSPVHKIPVESPCSGYVASIDGLKVGLMATLLGAGRMRKEDSVDPGAGILLHKKVGDSIKKGELLAMLCTNKENILGESKIRFLQAFVFSPESPPQCKLIETLIDEKDELYLPEF
jgi:pyrimidine-nucleoside phosphorylase